MSAVISKFTCVVLLLSTVIGSILFIKNLTKEVV